MLTSISAPPTYPTSTCSPPISMRPLSNSSPPTGLTVGLLQRQPRRPPSAARPSVTSANGRWRSPPSPSLTATRVSLPKARLPIMPSLPPSPRPLTSSQNRSLFNTKSSIKKAVTVVVAISSFLRTVSKPAARSFPTPPLGLSCSVLI